MGILFAFNMLVGLCYLMYGPVLLLFTVPNVFPRTFTDTSTHKVYHVPWDWSPIRIYWIMIGILSTVITIGLIVSWIKVLKNSSDKNKVVVFSVLNIIQALFALCFPIEQTYSRSRVHSIGDFFNWLVTGGSMESSMTLAVILVLVINIIYFNQPKFKEKLH